MRGFWYPMSLWKAFKSVFWCVASLLISATPFGYDWKVDGSIVNIAHGSVIDAKASDKLDLYANGNDGFGRGTDDWNGSGWGIGGNGRFASAAWGGGNAVATKPAWQSGGKTNGRDASKHSNLTFSNDSQKAPSVVRSISLDKRPHLRRA